MRKLTEAQYEALRWIDRNRGYRSEWCGKSGRPARGGIKTWTHLKITAPTGTVLIPRADLEAINPLIGPAPMHERRIFILTEAGRSALAEERCDG